MTDSVTLPGGRGGGRLRGRRDRRGDGRTHQHASNAFLATRISFINQVARICERVGADVEVVAKGMGHDARIGPHFLRAGIGYGGSCFPKDVDAFIHLAREVGEDFRMLEEVREVNLSMREHLLEKLRGE